MGDLKHLSVHQWIRSAIPDSQQPTSPIGFLFLKLPPPPCAVLLVHKRFYTQKLLHTDTFKHRNFYTEHTEAFKQTLLHRRFYTDAFTHRSFHTQHTEALYTEKIAILPQFLAIDPHFV